MNKEAKEKESKRGKRELDEEKERLAVVCKRTACGLTSGMSEMFLETVLEEEVLDSSGDESKHWCEASVWLLLLSLVNMVCKANLPLFSVSVSDWEIVEPHTISFSRKRGANVVLECELHKKTPSMDSAPFLSVRKREPSTIATRDAITTKSGRTATLANRSRCKPTMAVECARTRSHRFNGESLGDHRVGAFSAQPRR